MAKVLVGGTWPLQCIHSINSKKFLILGAIMMKQNSRVEEVKSNESIFYFKFRVKEDDNIEEHQNTASEGGYLL